MHRCLSLLFLGTIAASPSLGQDLGVRSYGLRGGINWNPDPFNFGAHLDAGTLATKVRFQPSFGNGFGNGVMLGSANFDAHYLFSPTQLRPTREGASASTPST
jgi:hypothetical protein